METQNKQQVSKIWKSLSMIIFRTATWSEFSWMAAYELAAYGCIIPFSFV